MNSRYTHGEGQQCGPAGSSALHRGPDLSGLASGQRGGLVGSQYTLMEGNNNRHSLTGRGIADAGANVFRSGPSADRVSFHASKWDSQNFPKL